MAEENNFGIREMSGGEIKDSKVAAIINETSTTNNQKNNAIDIDIRIDQSRENNTSKDFANHKQERGISRFGEVFEDHKYEGQLALIDLNFFRESGIDNNGEIGVVLDIAFGEIDEKFSYPQGFFKERIEGYIRFGIKRGKLYLNFENAVMPLNKRVLLDDPKGSWLINTIGVREAPIWNFQAEQSEILTGSRSNEKLGFIDSCSDDCVVEAIFKVRVDRNDLEITSQHGVWDSKTRPAVKETKIRAFFKKVLEPKLKDYLGKIVLKYD